MNQEGFELFFKTHYVAAARFACAQVGAAQAEDAVQDAFIRFYRHRHSLDGVRNLEAYFFRILYNVCLSLLRRRGIWARVLDLLRREPSPVQVPKGHDLQDVWFTLSPSEKAVLVLVEYQGWDDAAAAEALGMQPATLRVHRFRLREKIRNWEAGS